MLSQIYRMDTLDLPEDPAMREDRATRFFNRVASDAVLICLALFGFTGCANQMALDAHKGDFSNLNSPIAIFTLRTENSYKPSYQPQVAIIKVTSKSSKKEKVFGPNKPYKQGKDAFFEYLVSLDLEPGAYSLERIEGEATGLFIDGHFGFPIQAYFDVSSGIVYLGSLKMVNRQRKDGEERSGGVIPLIDQAVSGFSGGTFDLTISDRSETDIPEFIEAYPKLSGIEIVKGIMRK
jgi:hypothetical protein